MKDNQFTLIAGPCVIEEYATAYEIAYTMKELCERLGINYIFKASYRKANRTQAAAFESIGNEEALNILRLIKQTLDVKITTDVHSVAEIAYMDQYDIDIVQIPAFLCRQTDLLVAAAKTWKIVNIKKGQFANFEMMMHAHEKVKNHTKAANIWVTERGTTFGYDDLVVDLRFIYMLKCIYSKVFVDVTHSMGQMAGYEKAIEAMCLASVGAGAQGLFIETHPLPISALSDGKRMVPLERMEGLMEKVMRVWNATRP